MAIVVTCGHCQASFQAKDADAGKRGRCPGCRGAIEVPAPIAAQLVAPAASSARQPLAAIPVAPKVASPAAAVAAPPTAPPPAAAIRVLPAMHSPARLPPGAASRATATPQQILGAFQGQLEPMPVPFRYRLGIALVWVVMILLPACYAGLIALVIGLLGLHAVYSVKLFSGVRGGRAGGVALLLYLGPLAAGAILVFFMVKPFFAKPAKRFKPRSLDRRGEPLLFAFVERVCDVVGAPYPTRIDVDCQVNASASFRRGLWSLFSDDLVLTLGLPLAAGLDLRQFAGVLAHEFGHFSQGTAMRFSFLVRSVSFWFTRVVYERDAWDVTLIVWSQHLDIRLGLIVYLARGCIWLTRKALWVLMMLGHLVSGFLLRQMEFDADCYEARLAGSDCFARTARQLALLDTATRGAFADLDEFRREGRLADDLPRLIAANAEQIPPNLLALIDERLAEHETGLFDTHPCDRDRIANARAQRAPGVFHLESPATVLFGDFAALCRTSTFDFYRQVFGKNFRLTDMHPVAELLGKQEKLKQDAQALARYFQGAFNVLRPIHLPNVLRESANPRQTLALLRQAREQMLSAAPGYAAAFADYDKADTQLLEAETADALLTARIRVKPADFGQPMVSPAAVLQLRQRANQRLGQLSPQLELFERWSEHRLLAALELLEHPKVAQRVADAHQRSEEAQRILVALAVAAPQIGSYLQLRNRMVLLMSLASNLSEQKENAALRGLLEKNVSLLAREIRDLQYELSRARYPFKHAKAEPTLAEFLISGPFREDDWNGVIGAGSELVEGFPRLYVRMLGWLAALAEEIEAVFGFTPLPERPAE